MTPVELELKYGKKLARKLVKRIKLRQHGRVSWSARDRVSDAKVKPLTSEDVEIGRRPRIERFHFLNKSIYEMTGDEFYGSFFRDRDRRVDGKERLLRQLETEILDKQNAALSGAPRSRISPRNYWFKPNYVSPTPNEVNKLNSLDLRFVMMNEARKATFDVGVDPDLWDAFLIRVNAISANVSLRTLLRFLQIISKVQLRPNDQLKLLVDSIHQRRGEMKPKHYVFLFQAIGRLRIRDQRIYDNLYEMLLCWSVLRNNFLVKAANALAKLDVCDSILIDPLRQVLGKRLNHFTSTDCLRVKAITVLDLFTDDMVLAFLSRCEYHKHHFRHYSRNLEIIELYMRILAPKLYNRVDESTKQFLIDIRQQTSSKKILNDDLAGEESTPSDLADCRNTAASGEQSVALPFGDDAISHCPYLESISNTLSTMGIEHRNYMIAGPFVLDIYEPRSNTVIEVNREYQYYHNTTHLTSTARRRHELIAGMGFRLLHIPYRWWRQLGSDESKKNALRELLHFID
uniref:RAP domain-containing protein n=2 Tax=Babesia bovis TaxID=5865 RepID=A7ASW5_BABBO|eukprot:XP_001609594.1 hypothetical protein [Babesia bovis T2Bo]